MSSPLSAATTIADLSPADPQLDAAIVAIANAMAGSRKPDDFTVQSLDRLLERQAAFVEEVGLEAIRNARRSRSDVVSAVDIEEADRIVRASPRRASGLLEAFGGIVAGAALSQLLTVLSQKDPSTLAYVLAAGALVVGSILLTVGLVRGR